MIDYRTYPLKETGVMGKLGEIITEARKRAKISQNQLAARADVVPSTVSKIVTGAVRPEVDTLRKIADALGIDRHILTDAANEDLLTEQSKMQLDQVADEDINEFLELLREEIRQDNQLLVQYRKALARLRKLRGS